MTTIDYEDREPFRPDRHVALLVSCSDYSNLRKSDEFKAFNDMNSGPDEVDSVSDKLMKIGFQEEDIKKLNDPSCSDVKEAFNDIMEECWVSKINNEKILFYFYFIGHGAQDTTCQMVLNGRDQVFPIDKMLKIVASFKDSYVLALMDCTRKRVDPTSWKITEDYSALSAEMIDQFAKQHCFRVK